MIQRGIKYILLGIAFGIVFTKAEIISWFRIFEMFQFESFHMYGVIGSAVMVGALGTYFMKRIEMRDKKGQVIAPADKTGSPKRYIYGGIIFGLGWALTGSCPGPMYMLVGTGASFMLVTILSAMLGTFAYAQVKHKLPH
ncbi:DUF6691 family protein [Persicobacter diffluens]|uniref:Transporter n=1 Tax=Persicobacter diffluens TaxID=981 RepID=A0AAN4W3A4_9BACT|nr:transporter [Persicobacter diffluens]